MPLRIPRFFHFSLFTSRFPRLVLLFSLLTFHLPRLSFAAAFEPLGHGAAAKGMGGAYTAAAEDGSAAYWNPAGLSRLSKSQITASYEDLYGLGLLRYTVLGYTQPRIGGGAVGLHLLRLQTVGEASFFTYAENTYLLSYGRPLWSRLSLGANVRFYSVASRQRASAIGGDVGLLYVSKKDRYRLGLTLQDVNEPRLRWGTGAIDVLPPSARLGVLLKLGPVSEFTFEHGWRRYEKQGLKAGMAHYFGRRTVAVRAGLRKDDRQERWGLALGGGLRFRRLDLDYAWDHHDALGDTQTITISLRFGS